MQREELLNEITIGVIANMICFVAEKIIKEIKKRYEKNKRENQRENVDNNSRYEIKIIVNKIMIIVINK